MPNRGNRGFRWADLAPEHQKAVSHYTASRGVFPEYEPCPSETMMYAECLGMHDYETAKCTKEKLTLSACLDRTPGFDYKLMRKARRRAKVSMRAGMLATLKDHPRTLKSVIKLIK